MLKLLRKNQQIFIVFIVLYCISVIILNYKLFITKIGPEELFRLSVFSNLGRFIPITPAIGVILTYCTIIGLLSVGFYLVRININYLIIQKRTQFPAFFLISISSFAFSHQLFSTAIVASLFLLLAIDRVFGSIVKTSPSLRYLDAGILIAIGSLFYVNLVFYLPFFLIAQFSLKQFNWKEFLYPLIGLFVLFIYIFSGYYLFNRPIIPDLQITFNQIFLEKVRIDYTWPFLAGVGIYVSLMIIASFFAFSRYASTKVQSRILYQLLFYLFILTGAVYLLIPSSGTELFFIISIPSSVLFSIYFTDCRDNYFNRFIFILLLLTPVIVNILMGIK